MIRLIPRSLGNRLLVALAIAGLAIFVLHVVTELRDEITDEVDLMDDLLEIDIDRIVAGSSAGPPVTVSERVRESYRGADDRGFFLATAAGETLVGVNAALLPERPTLTTGVTHEWLASFSTPSGTMWAAAEEVRLGNTAVWVFVMRRHAGEHGFYVAAVDELMESVFTTTAPSVVLMLVLSLVIVRISLRPLRRVAAEAHAITGRQSAGRLREDGLPTEIRSLVQAINEALERLDRSLSFQREFTEDVAHELRTPLSILTLQLDQWPNDVAAGQLKRDVLGLIRFVEQLLEAAQIDALQIRLDETADLDAIARDRVAELAPLALHAGKQLTFESHGALPTRGNVEAIGRALRNLIENALKASPAGETVIVRAGPGAVLTVSDHGPGVDPRVRHDLVARFWQRDRHRPGAGLGLAIVKKTVEAHGGSLGLEDNRPRGAVFSLRFPPA